MQQSERRLAVSIGEHTTAPNVAVLLMSREGIVRWANASAASVLGQPLDAVVGADLRRLFGADTADTAIERLDAQDLGEAVTVRVSVRRSDGAVAQLVGTLEQLLADAPVPGVLITLADVTATEQLEDAYAHALHHDPRTGLPNLRLFRDRLAQATERRLRDGGNHAVVVGELDRLSELAATHGVSVADTVVEVVGARVAAVVRGVDSAARIAGDRFALLLEGCATARDAELVTGRLQQAIRQPLAVGATDLQLTMTCGLALCDLEAGSSVDEIADQQLRDAETALAEARRHGPGRRVVARPELRDAARRAAVVEQSLPGAQDRGELLLAYQPIMDLDSMDLVGVEALLRWDHPDLGMVAPGEFVPLAESTGLIVPIGGWVLQTACRQVARWNHRFPSPTPLRLAINVSALQLSQGNLTREVALALAVSGMPAESLTLELTETALVEDRSVANRTLAELHELGVRLSLDDFGTGSSLEHVQQFRFDEIKIERQFASVEGGAAENLADALITFGRSLGVTTVAEGIETRAQLDRFVRLGCDQGQGYLLGRPAIGVELEALLAARAGHVRSRLDVPQATSDDEVDRLLRDLANGEL